MRKEIDLTESLLFDNEFKDWLVKSDKMYAELNQSIQSVPVQQPVLQPQQAQQPALQQTAAPQAAQPGQITVFPQNLVEKLMMQFQTIIANPKDSMSVNKWLTTLRQLMK